MPSWPCGTRFPSVSWVDGTNTERVDPERVLIAVLAWSKRRTGRGRAGELEIVTTQSSTLGMSVEREVDELGPRARSRSHPSAPLSLLVRRVSETPTKECMRPPERGLRAGGGARYDVVVVSTVAKGGAGSRSLKSMVSVTPLTTREDVLDVREVGYRTRPQQGSAQV